MTGCYCQLPQSHCICAAQPALQSRCRLDLWLHPDEWLKPTNTARIAAGMIASVQLRHWQRTLSPAPAPMTGSCLLFPTDRPPWPSATLSLTELAQHPQPRVLLLDGNWKQCRKMLRQSGWLQVLPRLQLNSAVISEYPLRRGAAAGQLCTAEAVAEVLQQLGEHAQACALRLQLQRFYRHYRAYRSGHRPQPG